MKNKKALILIHNSPLQVLNALEAIQILNINSQNAHFIAFATKASESFRQIQQTAQFLKLNTKLLPFANNPISKFLRFFKLKKIILNETYGYVFISMLNVDLNLYACNLKPTAKVIFFDEGTHTLDLLKLSQIKLSNKNGPGKFIKKILFKLRPVNINRIISIYAEKFPKQKIDSTKNEYALTKSLLKKKNFSKDVYIVGQHLYKKEISKEYFLECLDKLNNKLSQRHNLYYIPHRHDSEEVLRDIEKLNIKLKRTDLCLELELLKQNNIPFYIIGFSSSALLNLKIIFGDSISIQMYKLDPNKINSEYRDRMKNIITTFRENNIQEVQL